MNDDEPADEPRRADERANARRGARLFTRVPKVVTETLGVMLVFVLGLFVSDGLIRLVLYVFDLSLEGRPVLRAVFVAIPAVGIGCAWVLFIAGQPKRR